MCPLITKGRSHPYSRGIRICPQEAEEPRALLPAQPRGSTRDVGAVSAGAAPQPGMGTITPGTRQETEAGPGGGPHPHPLPLPAPARPEHGVSGAAGRLCPGSAAPLSSFHLSGSLRSSSKTKREARGMGRLILCSIKISAYNGSKVRSGVTRWVMDSSAFTAVQEWGRQGYGHGDVAETCTSGSAWPCATAVTALCRWDPGDVPTGAQPTATAEPRGQPLAHASRGDGTDQLAGTAALFNARAWLHRLKVNAF